MADIQFDRLLDSIKRINESHPLHCKHCRRTIANNAGEAPDPAECEYCGRMTENPDPYASDDKLEGGFYLGEDEVEEDRQMSDQEGIDNAREGAAINAQSDIMDMPELEPTWKDQNGITFIVHSDDDNISITADDQEIANWPVKGHPTILDAQTLLDAFINLMEEHS